MPTKRPLRIAGEVLGYAVVYILCAVLFGAVLSWIGGYLVGITGADLFGALMVNWLALQVCTQGLRLADLGLLWNRWSADNLAFGLFGGMGAACLVLMPPLLFRAARISTTPGDQPGLSAIVAVALMLAAGSAGEEICFRGYAFQTLLANYGAFATIIPVGVIFALLHAGNPNATTFGIVNTAGFGILFGFAYWRSRDLWLPIGLHFGWNFTLPLFGANVSGLRMKITGYEMSWSAGTLWSGGAYGPEASVLTSVGLLALLAYLWKAPIRRQLSRITDPPTESPLQGGMAPSAQRPA
jgi:membrane protease YdiL (CAAX protease family)